MRSRRPAGTRRSRDASAAWLVRSGRPGRSRRHRQGLAPATQDGPPRIHPAEIRTDLTESLERLGTRPDRPAARSHRDDPAVPVGAVMTALAEASCSGPDPGHLRLELVTGAPRRGERLGHRERPARRSMARQPEPVAGRSDPAALARLPDGRRSAVARLVRTDPAASVRPGSPLARGYFAPAPIDAEPIRRTRDDPALERATSRAASAFDSPDNRARRTRARALATELGVTANQVALAWVLNQPFPTWAIVGVRTDPRARGVRGRGAAAVVPVDRLASGRATGWPRPEVAVGLAIRR